MTKIKLIKGDITELSVDAIVNAANKSLLGGGGVDGAIHKAAGPLLLEECRHLNGCDTGEAKITKGYLLKAKFVIHTVGPIYNNWSKSDAAKYLELAYTNSLKLALQYNISSIAFPNISTGIYAYPKDQAAIIATNAVFNYLKENSGIDMLVFCCFDDENYNIYFKLLQDYL